MHNVHKKFEAQCTKTPDAIALAIDELELSYEQLNNKANQVADALLGQHVNPGDFVGLCMDRSVELVAGLLGILKVGAVYVPLDPEYPQERLLYMLEDSGVAVVLVTSTESPVLEAVPNKLSLLNVTEAFSRPPATNPSIDVGEDQLIYMIYTSGSTGKPKGSLVCHRGFNNLVAWYVDELKMSANTRVLHMTSPAFDLTQKNVFAPLISGGRLCLLDQRFYDTEVIIDHIERLSISVVNCTPSAFARLLSYADPAIFKRLESLEHVVLGGEPIPMARLQGWLESPVCHAQIINSYGPTECTDVVSFYRVVTPSDFYNKNVPIGSAVPGFELFVVDEENRRLPDGEVGQLAIAGIGVGAGYHNKPEMTDKSFVSLEGSGEKIYLTGDSARILPDGNIDFLGRLDNQVKIRGFRIELGEIERALENHPKIAEAACSTYKDRSGDNKISAYLVYEDDNATVLNDELRCFLQESLPDFMLPTAWVVLDKLPLTPNGKLDRKKLPAPLNKRPSLRVDYLEPKGEVQNFLASYWLEIIGIDRVGSTDPFFELGGSSLNAVDFIARVSAELGVKIPISSFFETPTILGFEKTLWSDHPEAVKNRFVEAVAPVDLDEDIDEQIFTADSPQFSSNEDIAIIGMAGRFPGADSVSKLWENLLGEVESVNFASDLELRELGVSEEDIADEEYVRAYFSMADVEYFDADFFGYQPREVVLMDPQHRFMLESAWTCLDNAGYAKPDSYNGKIGVFGGIARDSYLVNNVVSKADLRGSLDDFSINMGNDKNFPTSRISYKLNLKGPSINVQTACSSSGVALHLACQSLKSGESDMCLVGGSRVLVPTKKGYRYVEGSALSKDGHIYAFDERGSGMVRGSGVGFILIKRLSDALKDGDVVRAVIKSTAVNNDGDDKIGYTAPSVTGQTAVIRQAIRTAGIDPESVSYIETHGTATALGDPIELRALNKAYGRDSSKQASIRIGSIKTNIGHLDAGAAVSGIIKTVLSMEQQLIPASLNYKAPNPDIDFSNGPFIVNDSASKWESPNGELLRAGVSSFGLGGTNFHTILEQSPDLISLKPSAERLPAECIPIVLSAKSRYSLEANLVSLFEYANESCSKDVSAADLAYSINSFRQEFDCRLAILVPGDLPLKDALSVSGIIFEASEEVKNPDKKGLQEIQAYKNYASVEKLARQWLTGDKIDWLDYFSNHPVKKVPLPTYKFDRKRYWLDAQSHSEKIYLFNIATEQKLQDSVSKWAEYFNRGDINSLPGLSPAKAMAAENACQYALTGKKLKTGFSEYLEQNIDRENFSASAIFMFPGGGSQYINMAQGLYQRFDVVRSILDEGFVKYQLNTGIDLKSLWFPASGQIAYAEQQMLRPSIQLPALFLIEYAIASLWQELGVKPSALVGHSLGENTAACVAGVMAFEECLGLVTLRGQLFERIEESGMLSVTLSQDAIAQYLGNKFDLATVNGPEQCTLSGKNEDLDLLVKQLEKDSIDAKKVPINIAAHSRLLDPILHEFESFASGLELKAPAIPLMSNYTGTWITDEQASSPAYWAEHLRNTVLFASNIKELLSLENPVFIECGPGRVLGSIVSLSIESQPIPIVPSIRHPKEMVLDTDFTLDSISQLSSSGLVIDWSKVETLLPGCCFLLPSLPPNESLNQEQAPEEVVLGKQYDSRSEYIADTITSVLYELSGILPEKLDPDSTFLELGFDSLFLTQANLRFKKTFLIKLTLRQLLKDAPTINELVRYIDQNLPESALKEEMSGKKASAVTPAINGENASGPELQLSSSGDSVMAGPFRKIEKTVTSELSPEQEVYLEKFTREYIQKTKKSQLFNEEHRAYYADPRTVMGFKQAWKDMTYTLVAKQSKGSRVIDIDGNEYVDCMSGFGAIYFGHSPDFVQTAVKDQMDKTLDYGPQSLLAGPTAKMICEMTGMERASFCNTGSEAVLAAIRISRTVTGNDLIVVFSGDYHGIFDEVLVKSQTVGGARRNMPVAPGIPESSNQHVLVLEYGDPVSIDIIKQRAMEIAAVVVEPVQSRRPELQPKKFLQELRVATRAADIPLVFDEIITGFRLHPKGAQGWFDVEADIGCYGKVIGGGYPVGVIAGKRKYLDALDGGPWQFGDDSFPEIGVTYFAGTFIRHPVTIAAVNAVMHKLVESGPELQEGTNLRSALFSEEVNRQFRQRGIPIVLNYFGSVYFPRFYGNPDYDGLFAHHLRFYGAHHIWGGRPGFLTTAHSSEDIDFLVQAFINAGEAMQSGGFLPQFTQVEDTFPWTPQQSELWLAYKLTPEASLAYNEQVVFSLQAELNIYALELAIDKVVNRHQSLRSVVASDEAGMLVNSYVVPEFRFFDISGDIPSDIEANKDSLLQENIDKAFDFHAGPLVRALLVRLPDTKAVFALCANHLVIDGWSLEKIMEEICGTYTAICQGRYYEARESCLLEEYTQELSNKKESGELADAKNFWMKKYQDIPDDLDFPLDHPRGVYKSYKGKRKNFKLSGDYIAELHDFAQNNNTTLFVVLLAAYYVFLNRITSAKDIVVGIPVAGQPHLGLPNLVAHTVSFLPLRLLIDKKITFKDFLEQVNDDFIEAKDNQDFGFGQLVQEIELHRDPSRMPLVSTCFNMDMPFNQICFESSKAEFETTPRGYVKYDLYFNITDMTDYFALEVDFNIDLFSEEKIASWVEVYSGVLRSIISNSSANVSEVSLGGAELITSQVDRWNDTFVDYNLNQVTLVSLIKESVKSNPGLLAVKHESEEFDYSQLDKKSNQLARKLLDIGLTQGEPVAIIMDRSIMLPVALLAVIKTGSPYLPIAVDYPAERIEYIIDEAGVSFVLCDDAWADRLPDSVQTLSTLSDWCNNSEISDDSLAVNIQPDDLAYIIYTSGSTGRPKGVMVEHRSLCNRLLWMRDDLSLGKSDRILQKTPYTFDVSVWEFFLPMVSGSGLVMADPEAHKEPQYLVDIIQSSKITLAHFVPSMLKLFLMVDGVSTCADLKRVVCSGEALAKETQDDFFDRLPKVELHNYYGPTEAAIDVTKWQCIKNDEAGSVPIGVPVANTQIYILDEDMSPVPLGSVGEIYIGGVQVARGYINRADLTAERFVEDPFSKYPRLYKTGDLGFYRESGAVEYVGRNDFQVKIRGLRVELGEIESALISYEGISQCVVLVIEESGSQNLVAFLVGSKESVEIADLKKSLIKNLPDYMIPQYFVFLDHIPLSDSGKVNRKVLQSYDYKTSKLADEPAELPGTDSEKYLASIWSSVLNETDIFVDDNFFDIGGQSLKAAEVILRVHKEKDIEIPLKVFINSSLGQIAEGYLVEKPENQHLPGENQRRGFGSLLNKLFK